MEKLINEIIRFQNHLLDKLDNTNPIALDVETQFTKRSKDSKYCCLIRYIFYSKTDLDLILCVNRDVLRQIVDTSTSDNNEQRYSNVVVYCILSDELCNLKSVRSNNFDDDYFGITSVLMPNVWPHVVKRLININKYILRTECFYHLARPIQNIEKYKEFECPICIEKINEDVIIVKLQKCAHVFCNKCLKEWFELNDKCPLCRAIIP